MRAWPWLSDKFRRRWSSPVVWLSVILLALLVRASASPHPSRQAATQPTAGAKIVVGPNVLVSRDGNFPHVELIVASNPLDPKNLVGGAITPTDVNGGWATKAYSSRNGGDSWGDIVFPELHSNGAGDPMVGFGIHGTAYFASLMTVTSPAGRTGAAVMFYRSTDGGRTWHKPADLGYSYDHEVLAVDRTKGKYAGRVYLSVLYGYPVYRVGVFRSEDDGRTFIGPVEAANGGGKLGINTAANVLVLSDGTLFLPYEDFEFLPEKRKASHTGHFWFVSSTDGGVTFSKPHVIGTQEFDHSPNAPRVGTFPAFAADTHSTAFRDRIYAAWTDFRSGQYRVWFSFSADRGQAWSAPKPIDPSVPGHTLEYMPALAVNPQGVLGITWFDTRASVENKEYDEYFTASLDGGTSFLPPVRVSSHSSLLPGNGNLNIAPGVFLYKGEQRISFLSAASRWGDGGDYMGLTADSTGTFHPFWADSRSGTFQIETAAVRVATGKAEKQVASTPRKRTDITQKVSLVFDPSSYDATTRELTIAVRLKNVSSTPIYGPIVATVASFGSGMGTEDREYSPEILNASNGAPGAGATFEFQRELGTSGVLAPGAVSGASVWRLRLVKPLRTPDMHVTLTGSIPEIQ